MVYIVVANVPVTSRTLLLSPPVYLCERGGDLRQIKGVKKGGAIHRNNNKIYIDVFQVVKRVRNHRLGDNNTCFREFILVF